MRSFCVIALLGIITSGEGPLRAAEVQFQSGPARTHLVELFTSEGCSSCPPAEKWLSELKGHPRLWKDFVPLAFHVDYWDRLGWKDRFAKPTFTARQNAYAQLWGSGTVYTPAFVLSGREWRERSVDRLSASGDNAGTLRVVAARDGSIAASYRPAASGRAWELHVALLGLDLQSRVRAGENRGRELRHDFVALSHQQKAMTAEGETHRAEVVLPSEAATNKAVAVWVTGAGKLEPIQATGGVL
jgi:hypothetical protein